MTKRADSLEEIAQRYEAMIDDDSQDKTFVPVKAQVDMKGSVFATQFSREEIALIQRAAKEHDTAIIEFIRAAALAAAAGQLDLTEADKVAALQEAQAKASEISAALARLQLPDSKIG